ncbi:MAG: hypothetical protein LBT53_03240 [Puniceicoccales bacterium]|jgi:hypothetical protein|nr:hypothetical protein [Puniceicoccales bacterium]
MANLSANLLWCVVRIGKDLNWWVKKTSDPINWDKIDKLSVIDPKQLAYLLDLLDPLRDYGLSNDIVEAAFIPLQIQEKNADRTVRLIRVNELVTESDEQIFVLPDLLNEEKSPYADFLDHITRLRVQYLNENVNFEQKLTVDELEDHVRENQSQIYIEGKDLHVFQEVADILEFIPDGYEIRADDEGSVRGGDGSDEEDIDVGDGFDIETDEAIAEDDTMRWDDGGGGEEELVDDYGEKRSDRR